jgi:glycosyltransferase involved in cell wall biosynthesis
MTSLILTSYKRPELLNFTLQSIVSSYNKNPFEVIVVNDGVNDRTEKVCKDFENQLKIKYIFTGQRNSLNEIRRPPSIAINTAVKESIGEFIIISCAEVFHLNNCIDLLSEPLTDKNITIPLFVKDDDKTVLSNLLNQNNIDEKIYSNLTNLNSKLPFLMGITRTQFDRIKGYDEKYSDGIGFDDNDFVDRLLKDNCKFVPTEAKCIHLYHQHLFFKDLSDEEKVRWLRNRELYQNSKKV